MAIGLLFKNNLIINWPNTILNLNKLWMGMSVYLNAMTFCDHTRKWACTGCYKGLCKLFVYGLCNIEQVIPLALDRLQQILGCKFEVCCSFQVPLHFCPIIRTRQKNKKWNLELGIINLTVEISLIIFLHLKT